MIRKFQVSDTRQIMELWLLGNMDAHSFVPEKFWQSHFNEVREALPHSDIFVYDIDGKIYGFIGLINEYISGIFVAKIHRSMGIGTQLLNFIKEKYGALSLNVYQKIHGQSPSITETGFQYGRKRSMKIRVKKNIRCFGRNDI